MLIWYFDNMLLYYEADQWMDDWSIPGLTDRTRCMDWLVIGVYYSTFVVLPMPWPDLNRCPHVVLIRFDLLWFGLLICCEKGVSDGCGIFGILALGNKCQKHLRKGKKDHENPFLAFAFKRFFKTMFTPIYGRWWTVLTHIFDSAGWCKHQLGLVLQGASCVPGVCLRSLCSARKIGWLPWLPLQHAACEQLQDSVVSKKILLIHL